MQPRPMKADECAGSRQASEVPSGSTAEYPGREQKQRLDEGQAPFDRKSEQPERQQEQPEYGIQHQGQEGKRPAKNQQDEPDQEFEHGFACVMTSTHWYVSG